MKIGNHVVLLAKIRARGQKKTFRASVGMGSARTTSEGKRRGEAKLNIDKTEASPRALLSSAHTLLAASTSLSPSQP